MVWNGTCLKSTVSSFTELVAFTSSLHSGHVILYYYSNDNSNSKFIAVNILETAMK